MQWSKWFTILKSEGAVTGRYVTSFGPRKFFGLTVPLLSCCSLLTLGVLTYGLPSIRNRQVSGKLVALLCVGDLIASQCWTWMVALTIWGLYKRSARRLPQ
jgi:hypothetical protein